MFSARCCAAYGTWVTRRHSRSWAFDGARWRFWSIAPGGFNIFQPWNMMKNGEFIKGVQSDWLVVTGTMVYFEWTFRKYWECHHPNWRTHIFQDGLKPPTRWGLMGFSWEWLTNLCLNGILIWKKNVDLPWCTMNKWKLNMKQHQPTKKWVMSPWKTGLESRAPFRVDLGAVLILSIENPIDV